MILHTYICIEGMVTMIIPNLLKDADVEGDKRYPKTRKSRDLVVE
jgi:hypothetical protein